MAVEGEMLNPSCKFALQITTAVAGFLAPIMLIIGIALIGQAIRLNAMEERMIAFEKATIAARDATARELTVARESTDRTLADLKADIRWLVQQQLEGKPR